MSLFRFKTSLMRELLSSWMKRLRNYSFIWIYQNPENIFYLDFFINPLPFFALIGLALNDHYLKAHFANEWTGKISDFCGVFYFPLFLSAIFIFTGNAFLYLFSRAHSRKSFRFTKRMMNISILLTALLMLLVKLTRTGNQGLVFLLNLLGTSNQIVMDPSDLFSLIMLIPSYLYASHFFVKGNENRSNRKF